MKKVNTEPYIATYLHSKGRRMGLPIGGNFELMISAIQWLSGSANQGIAIDSATIPAGTINVTVGQFALWAVVIILLLPVGTLVTGILVWYSRKRK